VTERVSTLALVTHQVPSVAAEVLEEVLGLLEERGIRVLVPPGERAKHPAMAARGDACCETSREELAQADLCLVLGGDGTMLRALRLTRGLEVPVAGVNLGRVGFFAAVKRDRLGEDLVRVLEGDYVPHPLLGLAADLAGTPLRAVNDLLIGRAGEAGISRIAYSLNGVPLFDLRCDALLVSTPAGSTAYNLAAGGPVMGVGVPAFLVTYVAPHSLSARTVVAAAGDVLLVRNESAHANADVVVDGEHMGVLRPLAGLQVLTVPALSTLALLPESDFYRHFQERFVP
jgi:NAD+ kinase